MTVREITISQSAYVGQYALIGRSGNLIAGPYSPLSGGRPRLYATVQRAAEAAIAMPWSDATPVLLVAEDGAETHTPGPWRATGPNVRRDDALIALATNHYADVAMTPGNAELEANARLIAAAPELLAALKDSLEFLIANDDGETDVTERIAAARAAIEKATK